MKGLMVTVIGMGITFLALTALSYILDLFRIIAEGSSPKKVEGPEQEEAVIEKRTHEEAKEEDLELVAVITAAIAASLDTTVDNLKVRSFRKIHSNVSEWKKVGRINQTERIF